jgi:DNA end-binding protein Ku
MLEATQRKVEGQEITAAAPEPPKAQIIDLMEALKASLAGKAPAPRPEKEAEPEPVAERRPARRATRPTGAPQRAAGGRSRG